MFPVNGVDFLCVIADLDDRGTRVTQSYRAVRHVHSDF